MTALLDAIRFLLALALSLAAVPLLMLGWRAAEAVVGT